MGAIDAAALGQFKANSRNRPTATDEKKKSLVVISLVVGTVSGKSLKLLPPDIPKMHQKALPQTA